MTTARTLCRTARTLCRAPSIPVAKTDRRIGARGYATKPANPTTQFYKTFTRPVAKVLLLAIFTYQFAYWSWLKLEADEIRADTDATIEGLEAKVDEYKKSKAAAEPTETKKQK